MGDNLIDKIKSGGQENLVEIYKTYKTGFIKWAQQHFHCTQEEAEDTYQDLIIAFYENVKSGKLSTLNCSFKTYLFAIGKNILLSKAKKKDKKPLNVEDIPEIADQDALVLEKISLNEKQSILLKSLETLGEPCQSILRLYYYDKLSIKEIVKTLNYKSENVVKVQKVRCMKRLKSVLEESELRNTDK